MLAGKVPFPGNIFDVVLGHRQKKPIPLESLCTNVPPAMVHLVDAMMAKEMDDRPSSVDAVRAALASIAAGNHEVPSVKRARVKRSRRHSGASRRRQTRHAINAMVAPRPSNKLIPLTLAGIALAFATVLSLALIF
jgi:hypothetical protein